MRGTLLGGRYRIQNKIGEGGMAYVYTAIDEKLGRKVAIKVLHQQFANHNEVRQRFFQEARAISSLDHPNILRIYDFSGENTEQLYIVSEILQGVNLNEYVQTFPKRILHPILAALIGCEILKALMRAHQDGLVHRDIKPENIMVIVDGGIKLMDFGIAKNIRGDSMTVTGTFMGSPSYMSPEQVRGRSIDTRTDLYSLGIVLYEICTGRLPFVGQSTHDVVLKIVEGTFRKPREVRADVPEAFERIICKAMDKFPSNRYQEARNFLADLQIYLSAHGFAESHLELERYFKQREQFELRLQTAPATAIEMRETPARTEPLATTVKRDSTQVRDENAQQHQTQNQQPLQRAASSSTRPAAPTPPPTHRVASPPPLRPVYHRASSAPMPWTEILFFLAGLGLIAFLTQRAMVVPKIVEPKVTTPAVEPRVRTRPVTRTTPAAAATPVEKNPTDVSPAAEKPARTHRPRARNNNPTRETAPARAIEPRTEAPQRLIPTTPVTNMSWIRVMSTPASLVRIDGVGYGTTNDAVSSTQWIKLKPGSYALELQRAGYKTFRTQITLRDGERRTLGPYELESQQKILDLNSTDPNYIPQRGNGGDTP